MFGISVASLLRAAGQHKLFQALSIVFGTFILEDAATVLAAMQAETGGIPIWLALVSLYVGIVLGDLGLYGLGRVCALVPWVYRLVGEARIHRGQDWLHGRRRRVFKVVVVSRFLPGMRLPTYTACGFLAADFRQFVLAAIVAVLVWTSLLFGISLRVGKVLMAHFGVWRWAGAIGFALAVVVAGWLAGRLNRRAKAPRELEQQSSGR
jgi:membrane protein DedA with SNARE-associated domain